jgi:NADH-quinone oxidoreductase subunit J
MTAVFYIASAVACVSTLLVITRMQPVHSLLYLIVSLLAVSLMFFTLGAPFIAALEVIVYAGAIMVLFVFVIMILNLGPEAAEQERRWIDVSMWKGPVILSLILLALMIYVLHGGNPGAASGRVVQPKEMSIALFGPYLMVVEMSSILLLAGLVGAYHLARRDTQAEEHKQS